MPGHAPLPAKADLVKSAPQCGRGLDRFYGACEESYERSIKIKRGRDMKQSIVQPVVVGMFCPLL
jgi:hypothetical protein